MLAAASAASAAAPRVRVVGVDTGRYPELRVTVVAPSGSTAPALHEDSAPVTGVEAYNLGRAKSVVLVIDNSQSMSGRPLRDAVAAARTFVATKSAADRIEVIAFGHRALALTRFSNSSDDADAALRALRPDKTAGTALWDGVALASRKLAASIAGVGAGRTPVSLSGLGGAAASTSPSNVLPRGVWASPVMPLFVSLAVGFLVLLACGFVFAARHGLWIRARLEPHLGQT